MERKRPIPVLAISILGICLGLLGACGGTAGVVGQLTQEAVLEQQRSMLASTGQSSEQIEANVRMQENIQAVVEPYKPVLIVHGVLNLLASLGLLTVSVLLLLWKPAAPGAFALIVGANVFIDIGGAIVQGIVQSHTMEAMSAGLAEVAAAGPQAPGMGQMMDGIAGATTVATVCIGGLWILAKLSYYVAGVMVLRKSETKALFSSVG